MDRDAKWVIWDFHRFNQPVRSISNRFKGSRDAFGSLMVKAVNRELRLFKNFCKVSPAIHCDWVRQMSARIIRIIIVLQSARFLVLNMCI